MEEPPWLTALAAQPLTGDLQRRWGPGLRFTLTFDMQTQGSLFLWSWENWFQLLWGHWATWAATYCQEVGAWRQFSNHLFQSLNPTEGGAELWRTSSSWSPLLSCWLLWCALYKIFIPGGMHRVRIRFLGSGFSGVSFCCCCCCCSILKYSRIAYILNLPHLYSLVETVCLLSIHSWD